MRLIPLIALAAALPCRILEAFDELVALSQEGPVPLHYGIDLIGFHVRGKASILPAFAGEPAVLGKRRAHFGGHNMPPHAICWPMADTRGLSTETRPAAAPGRPYPRPVKLWRRQSVH